MSDFYNKMAVDAILSELKSAKMKHSKWPEDPVHASAIVAEEAGELVKAALDYNYHNKNSMQMVDEAIQVGAMAIRFIGNFLKYKKTIPGQVFDGHNNEYKNIIKE